MQYTGMYTGTNVPTTLLFHPSQLDSVPAWERPMGLYDTYASCPGLDATKPFPGAHLLFDVNRPQGTRPWVTPGSNYKFTIQMPDGTERQTVEERRNASE